MRILTVRQPWAWAIIHGGKNVENRVRNIAGDYRGPVLIHVAKAYAVDWQSDTLARLMNRHPGVHEDPQPWHAQAGEIIGVVDLVDAHHETSDRCGDSVGFCSDWAERGAHHLVLANPRALDQPIPYKGALGLRKTEFFVSGDWLGEYVTPDHSSCTPYGCPPSCYSEPAARLVATS
ncbi:hypothetical protein [uncultured Microbacterium sp.]|uniref:hypothetical protein n=1 Tax=uncultured Microbacterium sp. TaxID=191216 RepID=UPI0025F15F31|nr:hypothetical protein [uncultured Microbacterium sp.]